MCELHLGMENDFSRVCQREVIGNYIQVLFSCYRLDVQGWLRTSKMVWPGSGCGWV